MRSSRWLFLIVLAVVLGCGCSSSPEQELDPMTVGESADVVESSIASELAPTSAKSPPQMVRHGFAVLDFRARRDEYDRVSVIGEVKNVSPALQGVELQAILRDAAGRLVAVGHFYPASNTSIKPNETWPFAYSLGRQSDAVKAELRIVGAFRTTEILTASVAP